MPDQGTDNPSSSSTRPHSLRSDTGKPRPDVLSPTFSLGAPSPILKGSQGWAPSPGSGATKAVSIAEPDFDSISPLMRGKFKDVPGDSNGEIFDLDRAMSSSSLSSKHRSAKVGSRRLVGRQSTESFPRHIRQPSDLQSATQSTTDVSEHEVPQTSIHQQRQHFVHNMHDGLMGQVTAWIKHEKDRRKKSKHKRKQAKQHKLSATDAEDTPRATSRHRQDSSASSEGSDHLDALQEILAASGLQRVGSVTSLARRKAAIMKMRRQSIADSSDGEYLDIDPLVPHADVRLDNSKTLAYGSISGESGVPGSGDRPPLIRLASSRDAWKIFQFEIVRLTHTLRLKGWRRVPMEMSHLIEVERLSGALTNAVYVVSPPPDLPTVTEGASGKTENDTTMRKPPPKLLLRIYGQNVSHLIDRESELGILRRLAKKNIGPKLLGTFINGRFEEFFNAVTLTAKDIRDPDMSKQIAKRMRELHDGIDLLKPEREAGPFVWQNVDKWFARCEKLVTWLDAEVERQKGKTATDQVSTSLDPREKYVCVAPWPLFKKTLQKYRTWLNEQYGSYERVKDNLVFSHNDAQYGNILRLVPSGTSPLLLAKNAHKRLVVIDFEYANANLPALEFANHFTEWAYNYHDAERPWRCNARGYPTTEEQARFIKSYLIHVSPFNVRSQSGDQSEPDTPNLMPAPGSLSSSLISNFMLDMRNPLASAGNSYTNLAGLASSNMPFLHRNQDPYGGGRSAAAVERAPVDNPPASAARPILNSSSSNTYMPSLSLSPGGASDAESNFEAEREEMLRRETDRLIWETRLWRVANSAQWVMWGVMQATIEGLPAELLDEDKNDGESAADDRSGMFPGTDDQMTPTTGVLSKAGQKLKDLNDDPMAKERLREEEADIGQGKHEVSTAREGEEEEEKDEEEFDYLAYARDRALFFWGDAVTLGLVKREELPAGSLKELKVVEY